MADIPPVKDQKAAQAANRKLEKVGKWRSILAGRILGTRPDTDPATQGIRDLIDKAVITRVEMTTLTRLCLEKGVFTPDEWFAAMGEEAEFIDKAYEADWPGVHTTDYGVTIDTPLGVETIKRKSQP